MTEAQAVMATNQQSWGEGRPLLKAASGATSDVSLETGWLEESFSGSEGLVHGQVRRGLTLYYARLVQGGGVPYQWRRRR